MSLVLCPHCKRPLDKLAASSDALGYVTHCKTRIAIQSSILAALGVDRPRAGERRSVLSFLWRRS